MSSSPLIGSLQVAVRRTSVTWSSDFSIDTPRPGSSVRAVSSTTSPRSTPPHDARLLDACTIGVPPVVENGTPNADLLYSEAFIDLCIEPFALHTCRTPATCATGPRRS
ncbi:hypothetical protein OH809_36095 [Streptomyces sp. NBC_00873]|uniref:hypothetical protein n=1 Tax=unclassified Streptomyces TaxID=2593676 RepID=UPI00386C88D6|nr:hypothetical protein OH809_36095 [Streptomyces sp. NBC_00873]WTA42488.1 hypothetical protein OH821_07615 [Streptomyces sp. NBC_00842]